MNKKGFSWPEFYRVPVVGIIRNLSFNEISKILPVYISSGLTTIEITMNTPSALEIIRFAVDHYGGELNIGAGTVCNKKDLKEAIQAGAQFIVTPVLNAGVIKECVKARVPIFPGAYTPTEIYTAWEHGASMVKVYPASSMGPGYIKDIKAPLNQIKLLPTGGIDLNNLADYMNAGANGLGIGSQLFDKQHIKAEDWSALELHFRKFTEFFNLNVS